jgi:outer membrane biosynthesis protein TonB
MAPQPIGTKKTPVTGSKATPPAKKPTTSAQTKTVPYKKPAVAPAKKPAAVPAKKPVNAPAKKPAPAAAPAKKPPQQKSWLTRYTNAAASGVGNFGGAIVTAAGNGVAGAGKGAGSRYVLTSYPFICH